MPAEEALAETEQMTAASASAALAAMKPQQAASIIQVTWPTLPPRDFCMAVIKLGMNVMLVTTGVKINCTSRVAVSILVQSHTQSTLFHALYLSSGASADSFCPASTMCNMLDVQAVTSLRCHACLRPVTSLEVKASCLICAGSARCRPTAAAAVCALHPHVPHPASPSWAGLHGRPAHHWSPPVQGPAAQHAQRAVQEAAACC